MALKIKLIVDVPVEKKHGMTSGREFEVIRREFNVGRGQNGYWVMGDAGEEVKILIRECEVVS